MNIRLKPSLSWLLASIAASLLVACGGGSSSPSAPPPPPSPSTGTLLKTDELGTLAAEQLRGLLLQVPEIAQLPSAERDALAAELQSSVRVLVFEYSTTGPKGESRKASALAMLPARPSAAVATVAYLHGTSTERGDVPSNPAYDENALPALLFAARGRVVIAPDYQGLGKSDLAYHPYLHRDSLAAAGRDALVAALELARQNALSLNGDLFVIGYSEGGFAAAALQRQLGQTPLRSLTLRSALSIAGPLDLPASVQAALGSDPASGRESGRSVYTAFTVWAYQRIYGDLYTQAAEVFNPPYVGQLDALFDGTRGADVIGPALPASPRELLTPAALAATLNGSNRIAARIRENDVIDVNPATPLISCHGTADDTVPYQVTVSARNRLAGRGFALTVIELAGKTHDSGYTPCMLEAVKRFR
jgi:predicted esterase